MSQNWLADQVQEQIQNGPEPEEVNVDLKMSI